MRDDRDMVCLELTLDKKTIDTLNNMTKKQLVNRICEIAIECKMAEQKAESLAMIRGEHPQQELVA